MSTRPSRKPLLAIAALGTAVALAAGIVLALTQVSAWAEHELHAFPFKNEDWLRYLLPARLDDVRRARIMLAGASTVRENLRVELFQERFPDYDVYQGGISSGTLTDVLAALEYVERTHGREALPEVIVLGISLRIVANLPENRPFVRGINLYSPYFSAVEGPTEITLVPKGVLRSLIARVRFLVKKQPERFRTALIAVLAHWLSKEASAPDGERPLARTLDRALGNRVGARFARRWSHVNTRKLGSLETLRFLTSPYKYSFLKPIPDGTYRFLAGDAYDPKADFAWSPVYSWDAMKGEADARARLRRFVEYVKRRNIPTLVVNMPERSLSRGRYDPASYEAYLEIVRTELHRIPFVDLWTLLDTPEFYDREHTTTEGSIRLTGEVIRLARETILHPSSRRPVYADAGTRKD